MEPNTATEMAATTIVFVLAPSQTIKIGANADFGKLEYCFEVVNACGLTKDDIWFPTMSRRAERKVVLYNKFD